MRRDGRRDQRGQDGRMARDTHHHHHHRPYQHQHRHHHHHRHHHYHFHHDNSHIPIQIHARVGASTWTQDILFNSFAPERDGTMMMFGVAGYSEETCILRLKTWFAHAFFHWIHADDTALRAVFSKPARHFTDKPDSNIVDEMRDSKLWPAEQLECFL